MAEAKQYWAIEVWGRKLGSYRYYVEDQQARAAREDAPLDAVYRKHDGSGWQRASELNEPLRSEIMAQRPHGVD